MSPFYVKKYVTLSNNFFSTQTIGLKLQTFVYINMYDGNTKVKNWVKLSNNFISTQRIELKYQSIIYINMFDGYTKGEYSTYFSVRVIALFLSKNMLHF